MKNEVRIKEEIQKLKVEYDKISKERSYSDPYDLMADVNGKERLTEILREIKVLKWVLI